MDKGRINNKLSTCNLGVSGKSAQSSQAIRPDSCRRLNLQLTYIRADLVDLDLTYFGLKIG